MSRIAVVVLDTLRKDAFDTHFDWVPGTRFENAYATSHYTVPSHSSLFTGLYPSETGTNAKSHFFDPAAPPLSERLKSAGYETHGFSANVQISRQFGWDRGFDRFDGSWKSRHANDERDVFHWNSFIRKHRDEGPQRYLKALWRCVRDDCPTVQSLKHGLEIKYRTHTDSDDGAKEALDLVKRRSFPEDAFLFVNLMEAHKPYSPPGDYRTVDISDEPDFDATVREKDVSPERAERSKQAYADAVEYLSDVYRDIFDRLREQFDYVITLSDHGEMFGERGVWGHGLGLHPELTHVPLSVWGLDGPSTREEVVSLLDVHRTVLSLAGADEDYDARGRDITDPVEGRPVLTEYLGLNKWRRDALDEAGNTEHEKYDTELYGIATPRDYYGYEDFDGFVESGTSTLESPPETLREMASELEYREETHESDVSEAVMDSLENLGYL